MTSINNLIDTALPIQRPEYLGIEDMKDNAPLPAFSGRMETAAKLATSQTASRMSIERYLQAPLEDEPASVPAINAALKTQNPAGRGNQGHTSGPESTGTSFSAVSRSNHNHRSDNHPRVPELPKLNTVALEQVNVHSPEELATGRTIDSERTLAELPDAIPSGYTPDKTYRARIEAELAHIQQKARRLEEQMRKMNEDQDNAELLVPRLTDEMAYEQMASKPKLAWILGGDSADARSVGRPKSSASVIANTTDDLLDRPSTSGTLIEEAHSRLPRRAKSSSAINEEAHQSATNRKVVIVERTSSKRPKFFCTFCHKRFHSRAEWMSHEKNIHMPEELWPLSERTFDRKDHFLQHISQEHKVSPGQKPLRLTELLEAWRHPLPLKQGHQALHCGFCGLTFPTYRERTEHVTGHFMSGVDMMSWWNARLSHEITPTAKPTPDSPLTRGNGKVKGAVLKEHISKHNFRVCNQRLYFSAQRFRQHLQDNHMINYDGTLFAGWTLLMKSSKQAKLAIFEAVDSEGLRRVYTDPNSESVRQDGKKTGETSELPKMNFMDFSETPQTSSAPRKKIRRKPSTQTMPEILEREVRDSTHFFTRAATIDLTYAETRAGTNMLSSGKNRHAHKSGYPIASHPVDAVNKGLTFYRRRLDASTRNRLYIRDETDGPLTKNSQKLFRKIPASTFGGLVLHSSLVGATPARLTNSVDIYSLH
ncbi:homeodomain mating type protein alpha2 [Kalmusia sp. IMI 367209]|nr:homeodomain mating type protein alpha2 [Kalmusia sp. IMI 367209]